MYGLKWFSYKKMSFNSFYLLISMYQAYAIRCVYYITITWCIIINTITSHMTCCIDDSLYRVYTNHIMFTFNLKKLCGI